MASKKMTTQQLTAFEVGQVKAHVDVAVSVICCCSVTLVVLFQMFSLKPAFDREDVAKE